MTIMMPASDQAVLDRRDAIVAALRAATGRELARVPVKPDDICL